MKKSGETSSGSNKKRNKRVIRAKTAPGKTSNGFRKQYLRSRPLCKVTFRLPKKAAPDAKEVCIVGDFNEWNMPGTVMTKLKNGDFKITLELPPNREYRFKYLIDSQRWENDWSADKYLPNAFGGDDSVVVI